MEDDRTIGCLPGETPASILLIHQERRHRAELSTAIARAEAAERLAVWAARNGVEVSGYWVGPGDDTDYLRHTFTFAGGRDVVFDGTDADLLRAIKEASGVE